MQAFKRMMGSGDGYVGSSGKSSVENLGSPDVEAKCYITVQICFNLCRVQHFKIREGAELMAVNSVESAWYAQVFKNVFNLNCHQTWKRHLDHGLDQLELPTGNNSAMNRGLGTLFCRS